jgi:hypothetical protein
VIVLSVTCFPSPVFLSPVFPVTCFPGQWLKRVVEGYYRYHAVPENLRALRRFRERLRHMWRTMLGRRSQRSRPSWKRIHPTFVRWLPLARVLHPYPDVRFDAIHPR